MNFLEIWECLQRKHFEKFFFFRLIQARPNTSLFFIQYFVVTNPIQSYYNVVELLIKGSPLAHNKRSHSTKRTTNKLNSFIKFDEMSSVGNAKGIINSPKVKDKWINELILHWTQSNRIGNDRFALYSCRVHLNLIYLNLNGVTQWRWFIWTW